MKRFCYTILGTAADEQTWCTIGVVEIENVSDVFKTAMFDSFCQLTQGKAIYGKPGVGCVGPYEILRILIERDSGVSGTFAVTEAPDSVNIKGST